MGTSASGFGFPEAEEYLLGLELFGMRFGLDRMHRLMTVMGLPQRRFCLLYTSPSPRDRQKYRMPSSA